MNGNRYFTFLSIFLCGFWLVSCTPKVPDEAEIVIISVTDIHGEFAYLPQLSAFVKENRAQHRHVIVVDAGDRSVGNPYNDLYEKKGFPMIDLENLIGVEVGAIGNHEFDFSDSVLAERIKESNFVEISANFETKETVLRDIKPYHIIEKEGLKIAFLSAVNIDPITQKPLAMQELVEHIQFHDPIQTLMNYKHLKDEVNLLVGLTHIGLDQDLILADSMPELNLIIGGHSHILLTKPMIRNKVTITQSGKGGKYVGKTTISLKKGVVTEVHNEMINLEQWSKEGESRIDSAVLNKIKVYENNPFLTNPVLSLKYEIPSVEQLGHMMTDAMVSLPNVDFAVINCPSIRVTHLPAGAISYGDILRVYPFDNVIIIANLKPSEIRQMIESEFLEKGYCMMLPSGFEYQAKKGDNGTIKVLKMTLPNGTALDENKTYRVGINNYVFDKFLSEHAENAVDTKTKVVDNVINYLKNNADKDYRNTPKRAKYN